MKNKQGITIAALIMAIVGLSIGFAAFSNTLNISSSASVNPDASNLKVVFAKNYFTEQITTINQLDTTNVVPTTVGATATNAVINNDAQNGPTLTGLSAAFTQPGQSVTYDLYVVNAGQLKAYLTDIVFGTTGSPSKTVQCTVAQTKKVNNEDVTLTNDEKATQSLVDTACEGISISVTIGELPAKTASGSLNNLELAVKGYEPVQIVISYAAGAAYVDGPMNVVFGDIEINAASVGASQQQGGEEQSSISYFKSYEQGVLSEYTGEGGAIVIPATIKLSTPVSATYNSTKCIEYEVQKLEVSNEEAAAECSSIETGLSNLSTVQEKIEYLYDGDHTAEFALDIGYEESTTDYPLTTIGYGAFDGKGLTSVDFSNAINLTTIEEEAFIENEFTSISIPNSITTIEDYAFDKCDNLETVIIGDGITTIGKRAFDNDSLQNVTINVACDTYKMNFTDNGQFGSFDISNIVWGTACTN